MSPRNILIIIACSVLLTTGQILWKIGLRHEPGDGFPTSGVISLTLGYLRSPYVLTGLLVYAIATLMWFRVLSECPMSMAYPLMSSSYILGIIAGRVVFSEAVPTTRWLGSLVICIGIWLVSKPR